MKKPKIKRLENGLRVIALSHPGNSVSVEVLVNTGSQYETKDNNGISHFLEHMCFKGTTSKSGRDIMHFLDGLGCRTNAFTDDEMTGYRIKSAKKHWKKTLAIVADIFQNPSFPKEEIEKEKGVIIGEINMYKDDPASIASDLFDVALYGDQPAGRTILGTKDNVLKMTQADLVKYHTQHYMAENTVVIITGDIKTKDIFIEVEKYFSDLKNCKKNRKQKTRIQKNNIIKHKKQDTQQSHIVLGYPTVGNLHKDYGLLSILSVLLGGGMSSRLFETVREELGAGYYVYANHYLHTDSGSLRIVAGIDSERVIEVVTHIQEILEDIKQNKITEKELKKVKEYMIGNLIMTMESSSAQAHFYGYRVLQNRELITPTELIKRIKQVSAQDLQRVAKRYLKKKHAVISLVGPHELREVHSILSLVK